jgi:hypothetical protein
VVLITDSAGLSEVVGHAAGRPDLRPDRADPAEPGAHIRGVPSMGVRPPRRLPGAVQVERYYQDVFRITRARPAAVRRGARRRRAAVQGAAGGVGRGDVPAGPDPEEQQQLNKADHVAGV